MPVVTFILGLCGSGKSWLAERMKSEGVEVIDESFLTDENVRRLVDTLRNGRECAVVERAFLKEDARRWITNLLGKEVPGVVVRWECFENDLATANHNCLHRKEKADPAGHISMNEQMHKEYSYPAGANIRPIHKL